MARGYNAAADLFGSTADGRSFADLYAELRAAAALQNEQTQNFISMFCQTTTDPVVSTLQSLTSTGIWEESSAYGVPKASRELFNTINCGATFKWYDARWAATWEYLADASAAEIEATANAIFAADQEHVFHDVMATIFNSANRSVTNKKTGAVYDVFAFANADGWVPPAYNGNSFPGSHTHYRASGAAAITSGDLDEIITDLKSHGYGPENGTQLVIWLNVAEMDIVKTFRVSSGAKADFIPSVGQSFFAANGDLVGSQPGASYAGFTVKGAYDDALIIESSRIPAGYVVALASGGALAPTNPILFREHPKFQGLTLVKGPGDYPLTDSYWVRGFGTGVRHRLSGMVMQITAGSYTAPALYV